MTDVDSKDIRRVGRMQIEGFGDAEFGMEFRNGQPWRDSPQYVRKDATRDWVRIEALTDGDLL